MIYIIRSEQPLFSFDNAKSTELAGVEVEFAKKISGDSASLFNSFIISGSFSITSSNIELGEDSDEASNNRPLQGQIPIITTIGLSYLLPKAKSQFTLSYKYLGKSLFSVGDGVQTFPWYIKERHLLNASFTYPISNQFSLNIIATNLLNTPFTLIEDANLDGKLNSNLDKEVQKGLSYQSYTLSISYNF